MIAHNDSKYDLPALQKELLLSVDPESINVIRKGCQFVSLTIDNLAFLESMQFSPNFSLTKFAQTFGVPESKGAWPYEYFKSVTEIEQCVNYPPITAFESSLMKRIDEEKILAEWQELEPKFDGSSEMLDFFGISPKTNPKKMFISPMAYFDAKNEFIDKLKSGEWQSMLSVLRTYNENDCVILHKAMAKFIRMVKIACNADVLTRLTLPGLAEGLKGFFCIFFKLDFKKFYGRIMSQVLVEFSRLAKASSS